MRVLIVGAGAIGALYGRMLQISGAEIYILCRSGCDEIAKNGIRIDSIWGNSTLTVTDAFTLDDIPDVVFNLILISTKVLPENDVPANIEPLVHSKTSILLIQNGLNIEKPYLKKYPDNEILSALAFVCSNRIGVCHIEHLDYGKLVIGQLQSSTVSSFRDVADMFQKAGVPVEISDNIQRDRWIKLVWNVPFNPLSVIGGSASTLDILDLKESRDLARNLMEEIIETARAAGYYLEHGLVQEMMKRTENMKPYRTSMLLDYEAGRPMEVEAIVGEPYREAVKLNQDVPHLESIYALLLLINRQRKSV